MQKIIYERYLPFLTNASYSLFLLNFLLVLVFDVSARMETPCSLCQRMVPIGRDVERGSKSVV